MAPTDTTTTTPSTTTPATTPSPETPAATAAGKKKTKKKKAKAKRTRKLLEFKLVYVDVTGDFDKAGKIIPGTERRVYVETPMPPGLDEAGARNRDAIERALKRAVYDLGLEEYGNRDFEIHASGDTIRNDFERTTIVRLLTPDKAEKVRSQNGKGLIVVPEETDDAPEGDAPDDIAAEEAAAEAEAEAEAGEPSEATDDAVVI